MDESPALPLFAPTTVTLGPVPTEFTVARLTIDGRQVVGVQVTTPQGVAFYFIDPDQAKKIAQVMHSVASGIIIDPRLLPIQLLGKD